MAEFVWLRRGDELPAVAMAQLLLNRTGARISVDGDFGLATDRAVKEFQRSHYLTVDGEIGQNTWPRLVHRERLPICDAIDILDPRLDAGERTVLTNAGGQPVLIAGMSNGIEQVISEITNRYSNLFMVRFHGHGGPGTAGVSAGNYTVPDVVHHRTDFIFGHHTQRLMTLLGQSFGPYGCIQFMHCKTGRGPHGRDFLGMIADAAGVPATAAIRDQVAGPLEATVRLEGPTRTVCPGGVSLRTWVRRWQPLAPLSFA